MATALDLTVGAVLFDMDGTLVDSTPVVEAIWSEFAYQYGADLPALLRYSHGRQTLDSALRFVPPGHDPDEVVAALHAEEESRMDGVAEVPGAGALMRALNGIPVAVVTSAQRTLAERRMRAAGLPLPSVLVAAEDVPAGKPSPAGYLRAARLLGRDPGECIVFEDAEAGLAAGIASGAATVVVGSHESGLTAELPRVPDFRTIRITPAGPTRIRLTT
ncbi:MAG: mannitol-/sugar-/sorbitol-6-phosphatase [Cryptosporangiaceae bacterium]|nr:mannitol-/sugar-/sorbitol-6-phosphatase [Cryptosporangiaceae bacterium]